MGLYDGMKVTLAGKVEKPVKKDAKTRFIDAIQKQIDIASGKDTKRGAFAVKTWKKKSGVVEIRVSDVLIDRVTSSSGDYIAFLKGLKSNIESGKAEDEIAKLQFDIDIAEKRKSQRKELKDLDSLKDADGLTPKQQARWEELDRIKPPLRRKQKIGFLNNNR